MEKLPCGLVATETVFGWTIGGRISQTSTNLATIVTSLLLTCNDVSQLWSLEAIGITDPIETKSNRDEELEAQNHFNSTIQRDEGGRYIVSLPWKDETLSPPNNKDIATKRLKRVTEKIKIQGKFQAYDDVFKQWTHEGIIREVHVEPDKGHFLPHRPVFKESETTPVRPVFDASAKVGRNNSLNECLYKGPNLLEQIPVIMIRFRMGKYGLTSDIRKAFQMLKVREEDRRYQMFVWWEDENCSKLKLYEHQRVVFGMNCSPFLLNASICYHLDRVDASQSVVAAKLKRSFYVDNCLASVNSIAEYEEFRKVATQIMADAKMELRQWARTIGGGNEGYDYVESIPKDLSEETATVVPVLGLLWDRLEDYISCEVDLDNKDVCTKRQILSVFAKVFDPMGFLCPAMVLPKLIIQDLWTRKLGWDELVPEDTRKKFNSWMEGIPLLKKIKIKRHCQLSETCRKEIHVFCDASADAYAVTVYLRSEENDTVEVQLLQAKSRLSPGKKKGSIPRLELLACGAGARLANTVKEAIDCENIPFFYWSDSTTALAWIRRSGDWGIFVTNRVREILKFSQVDQWNHVPGVLNPADLPSRGCSPRKLLQSTWWEGPAWLKMDRRFWPSGEELVNEEEVILEKRKTSTLSVMQVEKPKFSKYRKNVAVWGWIIKFIKIYIMKKPQPIRRHLTIDEMRAGENVLLRQVQEAAFNMQSNRIGGMVVKKDNWGLLRVETKLIHRKDLQDFLRPIVLPNAHPIVHQLIRAVHEEYGHAGVQFVASKLREKYWVLQTKRTIKRIIRRCVVCRRHQAKPFITEPVSLPARRVMDAEPFETTGVDLAGPLYLKDGSKAWIVLLTCAVYRCIHLDVVVSLSTEAFLGALERFIATHGRPNTIYSDNGTNFVGAVNIFKRLDWGKIYEASNLKQIQWIFNPPTAAWWGGWWERMVRTVKDLLKRMLGRASISYDELRTCLAAVGATVNDRPLTVVTEDGDDLVPLTPNMFLKRQGIGHFPETEKVSTLSQRYLKMKRIAAQLQNRFRKEYLSLLVQRGNEKKTEDVAVGDVVLIGSDNRKRFEWPIGIVEELIPGRDGVVNAVRVRTQTGILCRPVQRLYPLEVHRNSGINIPAQVKAYVKGKQLSPDLSTDQQVVTRKGRVVKRPCRFGQWLHLVKD